MVRDGDRLVLVAGGKITPTALFIESQTTNSNQL